MTGAKEDEFGPHPVKDQLPGVDFCVNSNPSWAEAIILGFQHYLVMLGTTVIIPTIIVPQMGGTNREKAELVQTLLFVSGVNTLLQSWFGSRLPVVIGGSYRFIIPVIYVALSSRFQAYLDPRERFKHTLRGMQGALIVSSILPILFGFLGLWRIIVRFLCPLSAVPLVTLVGLGLYEHGFPLLAECVEVGLPELIILILFSQFIPQWWKSNRPVVDRYAVLFSVGIVWTFAALLTVAGAYKNRPLQTQFSCRVDRSGLISGASWIRFPYPWQWGTPTVNAGETLIMLAAAFVAIIESTGSFIAAARFGSATHPPASVISRGIGWLGMGILFDGLWGTGVGSTVSVENVGLLALTRVGSRRVVQISAIFMLFFSILGKFGAVVASIPLPIVGALYCVLFAFMSSAGLGLLQFCNLNSFRTKFILGFSFFMGLSVPQYFNGYIITANHGPVHTHSAWFNGMMQVVFTSPATVAGIVALFLDLTLARSHAQSRRDSGRHWWAKFKYFERDARSAEFYSLPYNLSTYFPSV
ncbi:PREDICTED: nucleobase-ascorbate transporter 7-like [Ipomoea nil]|uniref:nucleobase-ascorbate transporter 7-like n=1 Tax=Ipomoea nil TaxID=35883 RepID=UPI00090129D1|nr:PREDICTED: nucleobase-ascorbate transporter 7-like [Ipomoea nil]XP_019170145.1 PREDICTED: nucleobase-ascorbate transporter 7-like [Ipomoea nil]XP_019170146.1 PREDICTED: nucleobase-ascorbate transporter 7-like [Ipomoea nil]